MKQAVAAFAAVALLVAVAATLRWAADGDGGVGGRFRTADVALRVAVQDYSEAFLGGDADAAYVLLSARCQARLSRDEFAAVVAAARKTYGPTPIRSLEVEVDGDMAQATYTYPVAALDQTAEPWVYEQLGWKQDDC